MIPASIQARIRGKLFLLDELHIEKVEETGEKVLCYLKAHPTTRACLLMGGVPSLKEIEYFTKICELDNPLGLHVHFHDSFAPLPLPYEVELKIKEAKALFEKVMKRTTVHIIPGQWNVNYSYLMICKELGLTKVHLVASRVPEVTKKYGIPRGIELIPIFRYLHDYQL